MIFVHQQLPKQRTLQVFFLPKGTSLLCKYIIVVLLVFYHGVGIRKGS